MRTQRGRGARAACTGGCLAIHARQSADIATNRPKYIGNNGNE